MIAPVGYIPLVDLFNKAYEYENEVYNYILGQYWDLDMFFFEMPADIAQKWVMEFCSNSLHLYNGSSEPIRISDQIFNNYLSWGMKKEVQDDYIFEYTVEYSIEKFGLPDELFAQYQVCEPVLDDDISALIDRIEVLVLEGTYLNEDGLDKILLEDEAMQTLIKKYCKKRGFARSYLFLDHRSCTVSLNLFNHLSKFDEATRLKHLAPDAYYKADILRKFVGYSLCIPEKLYLKNWENFWKGKGNKELQKSQNRYHNEFERGFGSTIAREREVENKFRSFISENGVQNITREEFYMKFGMGLSVRGKIRVWTAVAKDFPDLSKPGRKS